MRNNVLLWVTGWSFSTFNKFHKWVARVVTVEAILHSIGYTVEAFLGKYIIAFYTALS
jgi:Ferric reductase like transmembrane component